MSLFLLNAAHYEHVVLGQLRHPNILESKDFFEDEDYIIIVYELMTSDLRALLVEYQRPLAEK